MENLTVGRIVHYRPPARNASIIAGACQSPIVVQVWPREFGDEPGINMVVFRDGSNDNYHDGKGDALTSWATSKTEGQGADQFHDPRGYPNTSALPATTMARGSS